MTNWDFPSKTDVDVVMLNDQGVVRRTAQRPLAGWETSEPGRQLLSGLMVEVPADCWLA